MRVLRSILRYLRKRRFSYSPLIEVFIHKDALLDNLRYFQRLDPAVSVAPVLKSNAYGHGLVEVARVLDDQSLPFFCVDSYYEALILRNEDIRTPILILGYTPLENIGAELADVAYSIVSIDALHALARSARENVRVHLKIDTGMHRHGILEDEIDDALALLRANRRVRLEGVYTHLADADAKDSAHALKQKALWNDIVDRVKDVFPDVKYIHASATAGTWVGMEANCMRLGLGLYGVHGGGERHELRPALEMRSSISSVRTVRAGESIGYNATFTAPEEMRIATIPAGYYEGIDRRLSSVGFVEIRGKPCAIRGRVSMNITSVDVSALQNVVAGEDVVIYSADPASPASIESASRTCGTIPYELLVHIPGTLRRTVV